MTEKGFKKNIKALLNELNPIVTFDTEDVLIDRNYCGFNIIFSYMSNSDNNITYEEFLDICNKQLLEADVNDFEMTNTKNKGALCLEEEVVLLYNKLKNRINCEDIFLIARVLIGSDDVVRCNIVTGEFKKDADLKLEVLNSGELFKCPKML